MDTPSSDKCLVNVLGDTLSLSLNIQDSQELESVADGHDDVDDSDLLNRETSCKKCLTKCVSFPYPNVVLPSSSSDEEDEELETVAQGLVSNESENQAYSQSISFPTPLKLVSAMKGGREKQGASPKKLTVKWACDVYDPKPTMMSHTVKSRQQQKSKNSKKSDKKNGKKGHKGSSSRGGSGKDKKQFCKVAGSSSNSCGSSFLKKSVAEVH